MAERIPKVEAVVISDSFQGALTDLVTEVGGRLVVRPSGGGAPPEPPAAVMVLAGGREGEALAQLPVLDGTPWYFIGAAADHRLAAAAVRAGAKDYFVLPEDIDVVRRSLERDIRAALARVDAADFAAAESADAGFSAIIGRSPQLTAVLDQAKRVAGHRDVTVLLGGETGTGKELAARAIHDGRPGDNGVFVKVDCGTLSPSLMESELFGYDKGAFTDARSEKRGLVELAHGGTLFLDEIGNLPIDLQPKLLRLIEESTFRKVGGLKDIAVKIRIIAATNADIEEQISLGRFREDLFYRLNVLPIPLPPLRHRGEDVLLLADYLLHEIRREMKKDIGGFTPDGRQRILSHHWPGNIRELRNAIEREVIFSRDAAITMACIGEGDKAPLLKKEPLTTLKEMERQYIRKVLAAVDQNKSKAARILGISRTTLREYL